MILFMSPAGPKLRQYIRQYPSLVNCTSIDWFLSWPSEALEAVSMYYLDQSPLFQLKKPETVRRLKAKLVPLEGEEPVEVSQKDEHEVVELDLP